MKNEETELAESIASASVEGFVSSKDLAHWLYGAGYRFSPPAKEAGEIAELKTELGKIIYNPNFGAKQKLLKLDILLKEANK